MKFLHAFFAIFIVLLFHLILLVTHGYDTLNQIDIPMHLLGGFAVGILGLAIHHQVSTKHHNSASPWWYHFMFVIGFAMLIGVLWEFYEFFLDRTVNFWYHLPTSQVSLGDTMKDLLDDGIGASVAFWLFQKKFDLCDKKSHRCAITRR